MILAREAMTADTLLHGELSYFDQIRNGTS